MTESGLEIFHPIIADWFLKTLGEPTAVQRRAWPSIASGEHVLVSAPTGSGKTLTAFLWAIHRLATGAWKKGSIRVLYISPLKALNNDIRRNLLLPLHQLRHEFGKAGSDFLEPAVAVRSGDTLPAERRSMLRHPPEILITTPESLNLMLSSGARDLFRNLTTVILDELHGVIGSKRGVYLMTAVERLVPLSGEFQRIGLSATVNPLSLASEVLGGIVFNPGDEEGSPRRVITVEAEEKKSYTIRIPYLDMSESDEGYWTPLTRSCRETLNANRSTLFFVRGRRMAEKLTLKINEGSESPLAYAHHGSLSREIRADVEKRLKTGNLKAIVATSSLEMGIDIGHLDEVVLVQTPKSVSSAVQRIGRAGHRVGERSRGTLASTHRHDYLENAVLAKTLRDQDIESMHLVEAPLDVLAQVLVSMAGTETWDLDALFRQIRSCAFYRMLTRRQFDLVLEMLGGRYADSRIRELQPRLYVDRRANTVSGRKGALLNLYLSGGVIPDRGYYRIRHQESSSIIGELDEEYVWEARIGQTFTFGTQKWRIERITHNDVFVLPGSPSTNTTPFWRAEAMDRDFHFSLRIAEFLETIEDKLDDPETQAALQRDHFMDPDAALALVSYLRLQKAATGVLPHRHHILIEHVASGPGGSPGNQLVIHTLWGGQVNRPLALILEAGLEERFGGGIETFPSDDFLVFQLPGTVSADDILGILNQDVDSLLRAQLEGSGFFGARFRECAGRALLLPNVRAGQRMPLWLTRLKSQKLLERVRRYPDFPILLETWRTCLKDFFCMEGLQQMIDEIRSGAIRVSECRTNRPSPMVDAVTYNQINTYMYRGDEPRNQERSGLKKDWIEEIVFAPGLRPAVGSDQVDLFEAKRQRIASGYTPESAADLLDWVRERVWIPESEWNSLVEAICETGSLPDWFEEAHSRLLKVRAAGSVPAVVHPESLQRLKSVYGQSLECVEGDLQSHPVSVDEDEADPDADLLWFLGEFLAAYGPVPVRKIANRLGLPEDRIRSALEELGDRIVHGDLVTGEQDLFCDAENLGILLRMQRASAAPDLDSRSLESLPLFFASYQEFNKESAVQEDLERVLEQAEGYAAQAELWETEFLPARLPQYSCAWLDSLLAETSLRWIGCGSNRIAFGFEPDLDLIHCDSGTDGKEGIGGTDSLFPDPEAKYDFSTLLRTTGLSPSALADRLWEGVWAGRITNDTFKAMRKGIQTRFEIPDCSAPRRIRTRGGGGARSSFSRWQGSLPYAGNWMRIADPFRSEEPLDLEESRRERARILLHRYGVLFRELLLREEPDFQWSALFRTLRLMELSGEVVGGAFFERIPGLQFASPKALHLLRRPLGDRIFWVNASDPASCCGLPLNPFRSLPKRIASNHVVYRGMEPVLISQKAGKHLEIRVSPEDPDLERILAPIRHLLQREFQPMKRVVIQTINGVDAAKSPFASGIRSMFDASADHRHLTLYRRIR